MFFDKNRGAGAEWLVVGLGNRAITPDNIGPKAADQTMVTRHLVERVPEHFGSFRPVAALAAGVLGTTGMESGEVVRAVAEQIKPACVVAVDALASRSLKRLCRTVQLSDTGIAPGSGVGNHRREISARVLGVPVVALGIPTVVSSRVLGGTAEEMYVTPREIDQLINRGAKLLGMSINVCLQRHLQPRDLYTLVG